MKSVALHNLGCKVNSYEIDVIRQLLQEKGYKIVPFDEQADIYIINTCTVTNIADRKSRQMLHRAKKRNPEAIVVAVGCYVQTGRETLEKDDCIDIAVGNNKKKELPQILEAYLASRKDGYRRHTAIIDINHTDEYEEMMLAGGGEHTRAYIKIQDGCNQFCTYCIIPYARGRVRSRKQEDILTEVRNLAQAGCREVVLTGIHISSYGIDFGENKLLELIGSIHEVGAIQRIRLGSLEPGIINEEFIKTISLLPKVCPHFHLSLQSGCDETLKRMNRRYNAGEYYEKVKLIREFYEHPAVTTDVIVGFPGETEEEFKTTKNFLEHICFYEMHIFKYSKRQGTPAAGMKNQVDDTMKTDRSNILLELEKKQSKEFRRYYIGRKVSVLLEENKKINGQDFMLGHTKEYVRVAVRTGENLSNRVVEGIITGFLSDDIMLMKY